MTPLVTIVMPVLGDTEATRTVLPQIPDTPDIEIVIVDGGGDPGLDRVVATHARARLRRTAA